MRLDVTAEKNEITSAQEEVAWPLVTVNILAFNRRDEVRITLDKIINAVDYPQESLEIIVVDNCSNDGTKEMVAREFPQVKLIVNEANTGIAGWNKGFEAGTGAYFLVLDDDSAPEAGLREAIRYMEQHEKVGILACNIIGGAFTPRDWKLEHKQSWVGFIGCGAIIKREVVEAVGGYADWMFVYAHEWDYGLRCLDKNFDIAYFADCVVRHRASTVNRTSKRLITYSLRNELLIIYKHFPERRMLFLLRALCNNALLYRKGGIKSFVYLASGVGQFLRETLRQERTCVKREVQEVYANNFWSAQPVLPRLFHKLAGSLRNE